MFCVQRKVCASSSSSSECGALKHRTYNAQQEYNLRIRKITPDSDVHSAGAEDCMEDHACLDVPGDGRHDNELYDVTHQDMNVAPFCDIPCV